MNTHTTQSTAAVTGHDNNTSPAVVTDRAGVSMDGQSGGADRAPAAALPAGIITNVATLKSMAVFFTRDAEKAKKAAERKHHEHNSRACRRHAAALIVACRRGFAANAYVEACRIQREGRAA